MEKEINREMIFDGNIMQVTKEEVELEDGKKNIKVKPSICAASFQESDIDVIEVYERARTELTYDRG